MNKQEWRKKLLEKRRMIGVSERGRLDSLLCERLGKWIWKKGFEQVLLFVSIRGEPDLMGLAEKLKGVCELGLPVCDSLGLIKGFFRYELGDELKKNKWGVKEPIRESKPLEVSDKTVVLVPALAVDRAGFRLGYGNGGYDRWLAGKEELVRVGVVYQRFVTEELPREKHDVRVDYICSEKGVKKTIL